MAPSSSLSSSGMRVSDPTKHPPTRLLDVLFFIGLGVVSILIAWFSTYLCIKIYAMLRRDPELCSRATGRWSALQCCMRRKAGAAPDRMPVRDNASIPEWAISYEPFVQSPESSASGTPDPGEHLPRGLGIDFGDKNLSDKFRSSADLSLVPHLVDSPEIADQ